VSRLDRGATQAVGSIAGQAIPAEHHLRIDPALAGRRLDQALAELLPEYSRSRLQRLLDQGLVLVDGRTRRRCDKVRGGEEICLGLVPEPCNLCVAQPITLEIVFEDELLLVVDKPAGLVVHPAAGNRDGTLQNALLHHLPQLDSVPRAGIAHRLDKDTTGLLVVAKTLLAHKSLVDQLQRRSLHREYRALVQGVPVAGGTIDAPIGRDPLHRTRMAVISGGRPAVTHYRVRERFDAHTLLTVRLRTGRTHQIRVHMVHIRHPLVGDRTYGGRPRPPQSAGMRLIEALQKFPRQALHAAALGCDHPLTGAAMHWESPLPADMHGLLRLLRGRDEPGLD